MYACLHILAEAEAPALYDLALEFSPSVERTDSTTVVFDIDPLRKLIGSPYQIASDISRAGYERKLQANLAIAANPDTAILLAYNFTGVKLVSPGEEQQKLGSIPLASLFKQKAPEAKALLDILWRWGLKTCGELAALPPEGVTERLGQTGVYLRNLAAGRIHRPLHIAPPQTPYRERLELEHRVELLEPLLFLLGRVLGELCTRLRSQSRAARLLAAQLELEDRPAYECQLEFPVPLDDHHTMLKLLQLHLERHPPEGAILAFSLRVEPVEPRRVQGGMFLPPTPPADKLQLTLARIAGMVGQENVGTPSLLDTHRPDAFQMHSLPALNAQADLEQAGFDEAQKATAILRLAVRLFRPALPARVRLIEYAPQAILATGIKGKVLRAAGPWKTSGEWWAATFWHREEWDVALDDGALYRIYQDVENGSWFVHGVYD